MPAAKMFSVTEVTNADGSVSLTATWTGLDAEERDVLISELQALNEYPPDEEAKPDVTH